MELLIPGLILVALMVYASTRIKKTAAAAFEAETIETDDFIIQKPDGFLNNLNGDPKYAIETYSKAYGVVHPELRVGTASLQILQSRSLDQVVSELVSSGKAIENFSEIIDDRHYRILVIQRHENEIETEVSYKLSEKNGNVFQLEVNPLIEAANDQWVETFIDSFRVK